MKFLITFIMLFSLNVFADEMPAYMKDGTITVTLKDGKTYKYSLNEYKVVRRNQPKAKAVPVKLAKDEAEKQKSSAKESYKNRVSLVLGYGNNGQLDEKFTSSRVEIEQQKGLLGGVVLQHDLDEKYHVMGGVLTNQSFFLGAGTGF